MVQNELDEDVYRKKNYYPFIGAILLIAFSVCCSISSPRNGKIDGHEYVDLGLPSGNLWATCNVGAKQEFERGDFFRWGETQPSDSTQYVPYKWEDTTKRCFSVSKYCLFGLGIKDNKTILEAEDDAVTVNWGKNWRMPLSSEFQELIDGCTWQWQDNYMDSGMAGQLGTSKTNGNTIFLPKAGGFCTDNHLLGECCKKSAFYWTSQIDPINGGIEALTFVASKKQCSIQHNGMRHISLNVRGVCSGKKNTTK